MKDLVTSFRRRHLMSFTVFPGSVNLLKSNFSTYSVTSIASLLQLDRRDASFEYNFSVFF
jgi:hypothetical protein